MTVFINGEPKEFIDNITIEFVVGELGLDGKIMAIALNMNIVKQHNWGSTILKNSDKLEFLDFVGGG